MGSEDATGEREFVVFHRRVLRPRERRRYAVHRESDDAFIGHVVLYEAGGHWSAYTPAGALCDSHELRRTVAQSLVRAAARREAADGA